MRVATDCGKRCRRELLPLFRTNDQTSSRYKRYTRFALTGHRSGLNIAPSGVDIRNAHASSLSDLSHSPNLFFNYINRRFLRRPADTTHMSAQTSDAQSRLVGKRARIQVPRNMRSARSLDGLTGTVISLHPLVPDWVKIRLDANPVTPHHEWSIPADRLELI